MKEKLVKLIIGIIVGALTFYIFGIPHDFNKKGGGENLQELSKAISLTVATTTTEIKEGNRSRNENSISVANIKRENVSLNVGGVYYYFSASGRDLYSEMLALKNKGLSFKAKEFSGLGFRVDEINGVSYKNGFYWTLYINGEEAQVGASSYIPKAGDRIEWRYEKK